MGTEKSKSLEKMTDSCPKCYKTYYFRVIHSMIWYLLMQGDSSESQIPQVDWRDHLENPETVPKNIQAFSLNIISDDKSKY